jgi:hypothetical protein
MVIGGVKVGAIEEAEDAKSSDHRVRAEFAATTFTGNSLDIAAYGAFSVTNRPGADRNRAVVIIQGDKESDSRPNLTIQARDCFPQENSESCTNQVKVTL